MKDLFSDKDPYTEKKIKRIYIREKEIKSGESKRFWNNKLVTTLVSQKSSVCMK